MGVHLSDSGGDGIPLVLVHGWGCNGKMLEKLAAALAGDFRVILPDLPGHGETALEDFQPGFATYTQCVVDIASAYENPVLVGHSMGGALSLMAAAKMQVRAVVNIEGSFPPSAETEAGRQRAAAMVGFPGARSFLGIALKSALFVPFERDSRSDEIVGTILRAPESVLRFYPEQGGDIHAEDTLPGIKCPVLYIGAEEPRFDEDLARRLLPDLTVERIPDHGHFLPVYVPDRVAEIIRSFLATKLAPDQSG